ncbi:MAG TPA: alpha/beta fold hydrolase [Sandaracinaceae bacterium]
MLVETRLGRVFVDVRGEGVPVVLWPSLLTDGGMWRFVVPSLADRYRVITIDPPGHGRSAPVRRAFDLDDCAEVLREVLDGTGCDRVHYAGLSWGGMTGMRFAVRHPERLRSLALVDTNADRETRRKIPAYRAMQLVARALGTGVPFVLDRLEAIYFAERTRRERRDVVEDFRRHIASMDPESVYHCTEAVIFRRADFRDRLGAIRTPALVLVGGEDGATPLARARDIAERIPGAALVTIPGAGHLSALDRPERVAEELLRFFERVDAAA